MEKEKQAMFKQPKKGICTKSTFANGWHRVGYIPHSCPVDNGARGFSAKMECVDCGKKFKKSVFVLS